MLNEESKSSLKGILPYCRYLVESLISIVIMRLALSPAFSPVGVFLAEACREPVPKPLTPNLQMRVRE
jgi:hypothetical protein